MSATRKAIRAAIVQALKDASTVAGESVFGNQATPLWDVPVPCILVYARDEESEPMEDTGEAGDMCDAIIGVEARVSALDDLDDALDDVAQEIRDVMRADGTWGHLAVRTVYAGSEIDTDFGAKKPFGAVRLNFSVTYVDRKQS
jgi:hypothetical protein